MPKCVRFVSPKYVLAISITFLLVASGLLAQQTTIKPEAYGELKYRYIGPEGNRATSVAGVPGKPNIWYVGAASGAAEGRAFPNAAGNELEGPG